MVNKKRIALSIFCLMMVFISSFGISACKKKSQTQKYDIQFMVGEEVYHTINTSGNTILEFPANPTQTGYEFVGWYLENNDVVTSTSYESENLTADVAVYAKFEIKEYTISYQNLNGAENTNQTKFTINSNDITITDISKDGYTFLGWYDAIEGGNKVAKIAAGSAEDKILYARWTTDPHSIYYENTLNVEHSNPVVFTVESSEMAITDISKDGYTFLGWYDALEDGNKVEKIPAGTDSDVTLYARWIKIPYSIKYENITGATNTNENEFNVESSDITLKAASKDGYKFTGWYDALEGGNEVKTIPTGTTENVTVFARWEKVTFSIKYENTKGALNANPDSFDIESPLINLEEISQECFIFTGWYDAIEGGSKVDEIPTGSFNNITLYARWIDYVLTMSYNSEKQTIKEEDNLIADLFNATCTDNNLDSVNVSVSYEGKFKAGEIITIILTATSNGVTKTETIEEVKVYGTPIITTNGSNYLYTDDNLDLLFKAVDSFGESLVVTYDDVTSQIITGNTVTITASTEDGLNKTSKEFTYTVLGAKAGLFNSDKHMVTGLTPEGKGSITNLVIPYEINGTLMTIILDSAFDGNTRITSLEIPGSIKRICSYAFRNCEGLTDIVFHEGLEEMQDSCFYRDSNLTEVNFPDSLRTISDYAFEYCVSLKEVTFGENMRYIEEYNFAGCDQLTTVTITNPDMKLGRSNFTSCLNLTTINLPEGMKKITEYMLYGCSALTSITLPSTIEVIEEYSFNNCSNLRTLYLSSNITSIAANAFSSGLNLVILCEASEAPTGWLANWNSAGCAVYYGVNSTNYYNDGTFEYIIQDGAATIIRVNNSLKTVEIPSQITVNEIDYDVTTIGKCAFANSTKIRSIIIPSTITTIETYAFQNSSQMIIYCELGIAAPGWDSSWYGDAKVQYSISEDTQYNDGSFAYIINKISLAATVVDIITSDSRVKIPGSIMVNEVEYKVNAIAANVFTNLTYLESVYISSGISLVRNQFSGCSSLTIYCESNSVDGVYPWDYGRPVYYGINDTNYYADENFEYVISSGVASVTRARLDATNVTIPSSIQIGQDTYSVAKIEVGAFENCNALVSINFPETLQVVCERAFQNCSSLISLVFPEGFKEIARYAFSNCSSLVSVDIPSTFNSLGQYAFRECYSLEEFDFTSELTTIPIRAFDECAFKTLVIPSNIERIDNYAFYDCYQLATAFIPTSVITIGYAALGSCSLTVYYEGETIPATWDEDLSRGGNNVICNYKNLVIYNDGVLTYQLVDGIAKVIAANYDAGIIKIPTSVNYEGTDYPVVEIGANAFDYCINLFVVTIPASILTIGANAFNNCENLTINCEVTAALEGWDENWNSSNRPVNYLPV